MKAVLCIGGLDPAGRAGLLVDARAVTAMGGRPVCVAAALTYQSSIKVDGFHAVPVDVLRRQLEPVLRDEPVRAVKLGQLGSGENARLLASLLPEVPIVVDTPLQSSSGASLFTGDLDADYGPLLKRGALLTPNRAELSAIVKLGPDASREALESAALELGVPVLVKGGHFGGDHSVDVLVRPEGDRMEWSSTRLPGWFRGTGCRLASAIAARLAESQALSDAIDDGRTWLLSELRREARV